LSRTELEVTEKIRLRWADGYYPAVLWTLESGWTWDDLERAADDTRTMIHRARGKVNVIVDARVNAALPNGAIWHLRQAATHHHPNCGTIIVVGDNKAIRAAVSILTSAYSTLVKSNQLVVVSTMAEAIRIPTPAQKGLYLAYESVLL
jgi:hypothetical protein